MRMTREHECFIAVQPFQLDAHPTNFVPGSLVVILSYQFNIKIYLIWPKQGYPEYDMPTSSETLVCKVCMVGSESASTPHDLLPCVAIDIW